jgi:hypothetical protein
VEAYRLSELLGLHVVPATVYADMDGTPGTSQQYLPDLRTGRELRLDAQWHEIDQDQFEDVLILDILTMNNDRNPGNWGLDATGRLWAIDHGHAGFTKAASAPIYVGGEPDSVSGPRGLMGTSDLINYVNESRRPSAQRSQANVANWDSARNPPLRILTIEKRQELAGKERLWLHGWLLPEPKLERLRRITRDQVTDAIVGERPERWSERERQEKHTRAANVWSNLQMLTANGALTWW